MDFAILHFDSILMAQKPNVPSTPADFMNIGRACSYENMASEAGAGKSEAVSAVTNPLAQLVVLELQKDRLSERLQVKKVQ